MNCQRLTFRAPDEPCETENELTDARKAQCSNLRTRKAKFGISQSYRVPQKHNKRISEQEKQTLEFPSPPEFGRRKHNNRISEQEKQNFEFQSSRVSQKTQMTRIARRSSYEKSRNVCHQRFSSVTSSSKTPRASLYRGQYRQRSR